MDVFTVAVLTLSDKGARGERADVSGQILAEMLGSISGKVEKYEVIPDEKALIQEKLVYYADQLGVDVIATTGGTGVGPRDVTPEATAAVCDKLLDGFGEQMRAVSLKIVPTAILSRQIAGIRGQSLIVNLPGKPSAIRDCLLAVFPAIPYCIDLIEGPYLTTNENLVKAFRPKR